MGGSQVGNFSEVGFGRANRPSTPIKGVIANNFGNYAEAEINQTYEVIQYHTNNRSRKVPGAPGIRKNNALILKEKFDMENRQT